MIKTITNTQTVERMNSTSSKAFLVTAMNCENRSHAHKISALLGAFPRQDYGTFDEPSISFAMMVKADSLASVQTAIAPALGKANAAIGEMSFFPITKCHLSRSRSCGLSLQHEVSPRKGKRGFDLISDVLPFGRLWYGEPNAISNAVSYAKHCSRWHDAVIRVYDADEHKTSLLSSVRP